MRNKVRRVSWYQNKESLWKKWLSLYQLKTQIMLKIESNHYESTRWLQKSSCTGGGDVGSAFASIS